MESKHLVKQVCVGSSKNFLVQCDRVQPWLITLGFQFNIHVKKTMFHNINVKKLLIRVHPNFLLRKSLVSIKILPPKFSFLATSFFE